MRPSRLRPISLRQPHCIVTLQAGHYVLKSRAQMPDPVRRSSGGFRSRAPGRTPGARAGGGGRSAAARGAARRRARGAEGRREAAAGARAARRRRQGALRSPLFRSAGECNVHLLTVSDVPCVYCTTCIARRCLSARCSAGRPPVQWSGVGASTPLHHRIGDAAHRQAAVVQIFQRAHRCLITALQQRQTCTEMHGQGNMNTACRRPPMRRRGARQRMRSAGATRRLLRGGAHPLAVPLMLPKLRSTQQSVPVPRHSACAQTSKQAEHRLRVMCTLLAGCGLETAPYVTGADTRLVRATLVTRLTASVHHHGAVWCHCSSPRLRCGRQARAGGGRAA